jgi:two-component system copper resistance phosphate regulon response regulator CusR
MKILVVEDEIRVADFIKKGLEEELFDVEIANDGEEGWQMTITGRYNLLLLDLNLPKIKGIELCNKIRSANITTPILILSAYGTTESKVMALNCGADDFLVKPFKFAELVARVRALLRRPLGMQTKQSYKFADLTLDNITKTVKRGENPIHLTAREFRLLEFLMRTPGRVISRAEIAEEVWEVPFDTGTNLIDVYVNYLRSKINKDSEIQLIHTVRGMGYVLREETENRTTPHSN